MRVTQVVCSVLAAASMVSAEWTVGFFESYSCQGNSAGAGDDVAVGCTNLNHNGDLISASLTGTESWKVTLYCENDCGGAHPMGLTGGCVEARGDCPNIKSYKYRSRLLKSELDYLLGYLQQLRSQRNTININAIEVLSGGSANRFAVML
ncbi:hypothetical protein N7532_009389 [Penicillium argentinense]|uniref:Cyanovirin-N domain-containing protein n=1 Tax=Penicillium argentinense TaxID=1131581 RepID=A0A9W9K2T6_9EURO|nr:uncharacterized protein N7532_009389 [Penicillium argentinense]KAJ5090705.1 hypothetical protein N7532_009389 [Penicillium argentinense]